MDWCPLDCKCEDAAETIDRLRRERDRYKTGLEKIAGAWGRVDANDMALHAREALEAADE